MTPGVSAGSNHVGASDTVAARVTRPSAAAAGPARSTPRTRASAAASREATSMAVLLDPSWPNLATGRPGGQWAGTEAKRAPCLDRLVTLPVASRCAAHDLRMKPAPLEYLAVSTAEEAVAALARFDGNAR